MPIDFPESLFRFKPKYEVGYDDSPQGFQLAWAITTNIYLYYIDTANEVIKDVRTARRVPFPNFQSTIRPIDRPTAALTPVIVGVGYIAMLNTVAICDEWPGHFNLTIMGEFPFRVFGKISVDNSPLPLAATTGPNTLSGGSKPTAASLTSLPFDGQQNWLRCFANVLMEWVRYPPDGNVIDIPRYERRPGDAVYHLGDHQGWELTFTVKRTLRIQALKWKRVLSALVSLVLQAGTSEGGWQRLVDVIVGGFRLATLQIVPPSGKFVRSVDEIETR